MTWTRTSRQDQERPRSPGFSGALPCCFPDICSTFPFGAAGKGSGMERKITPPPTAATRQGRRAAGREPAGHSRAYLWSALSSLQSEALRGVTGLCRHTRPGPNTTRGKKHTLLLLPCARQPIVHTQARGKGTTPFQRRIGPHQQSGSPLLLTHAQAWAETRGRADGSTMKTCA